MKANVFFLICLIPIAFGIKCKRLTRYPKDYTTNRNDYSVYKKGSRFVRSTCTGDYCTVLQNGNGVIQSRDCASGPVLETGCVRSEDYINATKCICNTDYCNKGNIYRRGEKLPEIICHAKIEKPSTLVDLNNRTGHFCVADGIQQLKANNKTDWEKSYGAVFNEFPSIITQPFGNAYLNVLYAYQRTPNTIEYFRRCNSDFCNTDFKFEDVKIGSVRCRSRTYGYGKQDGECQGDFCVIVATVYRTILDNGEELTRHFRSDVSYDQLCLSANEELSSHKLEVGVQSYLNRNVYICQEDGCNSSIAEAMKSISVYNMKKLLQNYQ